MWSAHCQNMTRTSLWLEIESIHLNTGHFKLLLLQFAVTSNLTLTNAVFTHTFTCLVRSITAAQESARRCWCSSRSLFSATFRSGGSRASVADRAVAALPVLVSSWRDEKGTDRHHGENLKSLHQRLEVWKRGSFFLLDKSVLFDKAGTEWYIIVTKSLTFDTQKHP